MELPYLTIVIALLAFISLILGLTRGLKRSFYSFITNVIAVIAAFGITRIVILIMSKRGLAPIGEKVLNNKIFQGVINPSGLEYTNKFIGTLVLSVCLFYCLYLLLLLISEPIKRSIFTKATKVEYSKYNVLLEKKWYIKILAAILSIISCAVTCYVLTFTVLSVSESLDNAYTKTATSKNYVVSIIEKDKTSSIIRRLGTKPVFNFLTKMHDNDVKTVTTNEIEAALEVYYSINNIRNEKDIYENLDVLNTAINSTEIVPEFAAKMIVDEANKYQIDVPKKNAKGMNARYDRLKNELLSLMKSSNRENLKPNTKTATNIGKEVALKEAYKISSYEELINLLKNEGFTEKVLLELYENPNTQNVMSSLIDFCIGSVFDSIDIDVKETYIFSLDYSKLTRPDIKNEAKAISIYAQNAEIINKLSKEEKVDKEKLEELKEKLEDLKNSKIVTDTVYTSLNGFIKTVELIVEDTGSENAPETTDTTATNE